MGLPCKLLTILAIGALCINTSTEAGGSGSISCLESGLTHPGAKARSLGADSELQQHPNAPPTYVTASASNGREMVAALFNPVVDLINLTRPVVNVTPEDWQTSNVELPIVLTRNVTIGGQLNDWPQLNLIYVRDVVQLKGTVRMTFHYVYVYMGGLLGNPNRLSGTDIFVPTDPGGPPGEVWFSTAAVHTPYCFQGYFQLLDFSLMPRPAQYPGNQTMLVDVAQDGCVDSKDAPPLQRCWADKVFSSDWAFEGTDFDATSGALRTTNLLFRFLNTIGVCEVHIELDCLQKKDPLVCYAETVNKGKGSGGNSTSDSSLAASTLLTNDHSTSSNTAVVVGATVAAVVGFALLLGLATAALLGWQGRDPTADLAAAAAAAGGDGDTSSGAPAAGTSLVQLRTCGVQQQGRSTYRAEGTHTSTAPESFIPANSLCMLLESSLLPAKQQPPAGARKTKAIACADIATPVTAKTPRRPDIPLNITLVSLQHLPPAAAATAGFAGGDHYYPQPGPGAAAPAPTAAVADATAAGLRAINEKCTLMAPGSKPPEAEGSVGAAGGGGGLGQSESAVVGPVAMDAAVLLQEGLGCDSSSRSELMPSSNTSSGEGSGVVCLLPVVRGKGTYGRVVEGLYAGRRVAVKLMANEELLGLEAGPSESFIRTFAQEVEVLGRCQHPNIIQLLAACVSPPRLCLVMELMETSLDKLLYHIPGQRPMPLPKVLHIGICISNALAYLHPTITHRDLKPANVLIDDPQSDQPTVKLTDFGLARLRMTVKSTEHPDAGTPAYMAPECFDATNWHVTHKADMYSLGVLLWEMLTTTKPWKGVGLIAIGFLVTYKGLRPPLESLISSGCPRKLLRLLEACWDGDPARRPAAAEAAKMLTLVMQSLERDQQQGDGGVGGSSQQLQHQENHHHHQESQQ